MSRIPDPGLAASQPGAPERAEPVAEREAAERGTPAEAERRTAAPRDTAAREDVRERVSHEDRPAREQRVAHEEVVERETVAGPGAADDDLSAPAVVDGQEVETNEQAERKGKKKRGFLSRFFDL